MNHHPVISTSGIGVEESRIHSFELSIRGSIVRSGESSYDTARKVWNGMIDKYPSMIIYCDNPSDVLKAVNFSRDNSLLVAVRSGGHSVAGNSVCNEGVVIDLSRMKEIRVDTANRTSHAQAGMTWGDYDHATQKYGFSSPGGIISSTGIAGLTLGGGIGWLTRKYGLSADNLIAAYMITAAGERITANIDQNQDLFWGICGGGGNFGIVTQFTYRLHKLHQVFAGTLFFPAEKAMEILRFYRDYISHVPDELATMVALLSATHPGLPYRFFGSKVLAIHVCFVGNEDDGSAVLNPMRKQFSPLKDSIRTMSYTDLQAMLDSGSPPGHMNYWKSSYLSALNDSVIDTIISHFDTIPSSVSQIHLQHMQGAVSRVREDATAFSHRDSLFVMNIVSKWIDPEESEKNIAWTRSLSTEMEPFSRGTYVNFLGEENEERIKSAYSQENYNRLVELKTKYDPENFFSLNQNIKPKV